MEGSPCCETNRKVNYRLHKNAWQVLILGHMTPDHIVIPFFKTHFNMYLPNGLVPSDFPTVILYAYWNGVALGYGIGYRGFESRQGLGIFLFTTVSRPDLGPT
jgi:hypothetical protein